MCLDDKFGGSGLEAYATFDADDGVAHIAVASDGVRSTNLFYLLYGGNLVVKLLAIYSHNLALLEGDLQFGLLVGGGNVLEVSLFGQTLCGVENFPTADAGAPDAYVV